MTRRAVKPGALVAYASPDGTTRIGEVLELRTDGFVRLRLLGDTYSTHAHERWISDLTPQEMARVFRQAVSA